MAGIDAANTLFNTQVQERRANIFGLLDSGDSVSDVTEGVGEVADGVGKVKLAVSTGTVKVVNELTLIESAINKMATRLEKAIRRLDENASLRESRNKRAQHPKEDALAQSLVNGRVKTANQQGSRYGIFDAALDLFDLKDNKRRPKYRKPSVNFRGSSIGGRFNGIRNVASLGDDVAKPGVINSIKNFGGRGIDFAKNLFNRVPGSSMAGRGLSGVLNTAEKVAVPLAAAATVYDVANAGDEAKAAGKSATGAGINATAGDVIAVPTLGMSKFAGIDTLGDAATFTPKMYGKIAGLLGFDSLATSSDKTAKSMSKNIDTSIDYVGKGIDTVLDKTGVGTAVGRASSAMIAMNPALAFTDLGKDAREALYNDFNGQLSDIKTFIAHPKDEAVKYVSNKLAVVGTSLEDAKTFFTKTFGGKDSVIGAFVTSFANFTEKSEKFYDTAADDISKNLDSVVSALSNTPIGQAVGAVVDAGKQAVDAGVSTFNTNRASGKGVAASTVDAGSKIVGSFTGSIAEQTQAALDKGIKYGFGSKNVNSGKIDCSGWVSSINKSYMDSINQEAGKEVYGKEAKKALTGSAAEIIDNVGKATGKVLTNAELKDPNAIKDGMLIGLDTGDKEWDRGRARGVDHIVQAYKDPVTGEMMVSESRGKKGVMRSKLSDWKAKYDASGAKMYAVDPSAMAKDQKAAADAKVKVDKAEAKAVTPPTTDTTKTATPKVDVKPANAVQQKPATTPEVKKVEVTNQPAPVKQTVQTTQPAANNTTQSAPTLNDLPLYVPSGALSLLNIGHV